MSNIYIYSLFWTIQSCIHPSWAWGKLGDKPSRSFSWRPQWWSVGWWGASRLSQTYSGTLAFSDQEPSENRKAGLVTKISEGHLSITIPNKKTHLFCIKYFILHEQGSWLLDFSHSLSLKFICPSETTVSVIDSKIKTVLTMCLWLGSF